MWSEILPSGKVRFKERYTNPLTGKQSTVSTTADKETNATKKAAERILQDKIRKALSKTETVSSYTLSEILEAYDAYQKEHVKISTYTTGMDSCALSVRAIGADIIADKLTAAYVRKAFEGLSASSFNSKISYLKAMLRWAYQQDMVKNIAWIDKLARKSDDRKARIEDKFLERE